MHVRFYSVNTCSCIQKELLVCEKSWRSIFLFTLFFLGQPMISSDVYMVLQSCLPDAMDTICLVGNKHL